MVFSLLFLVVQYGNTTVSPRLTLFRDDPAVWHTFAYFSAVFVFTTTAGVRLGTTGGTVTVAVPTLAIVLVLGALLLARALQLRALGLLQFPATMEQIRQHGEAVINALDTTPHLNQPPPNLADVLPSVATPLRWTEATVLVRQIDLPRLYNEAVHLDAVVQLDVMVGGELKRGTTVGTIHAATAVDGTSVLASLSTGTDRSFAQDPLLAFRLLSDIADRALSPAVNDPATAVQALGCVHDLLVLVIDKQLDVGVVTDETDRPRVLLSLPTREDYVMAAIDEIAYYGRDAPTVRARVQQLLDDLLQMAPPDRRPVLTGRLDAAPRLPTPER